MHLLKSSSVLPVMLSVVPSDDFHWVLFLEGKNRWRWENAGEGWEGMKTDGFKGMTFVLGTSYIELQFLEFYEKKWEFDGGRTLKAKKKLSLKKCSSSIGNSFVVWLAMQSLICIFIQAYIHTANACRGVYPLDTEIQQEFEEFPVLGELGT